MKEIYQDGAMEVIEFEVWDIITTSGTPKETLDPDELPTVNVP